MLKNLSNWIYRISSGWVALAGVVIFFLFIFLVLPGQSAGDADLFSDAGIPDLSFYYSADDLYRMADDYGEDGREAYIRARFTFDLIWPLVYTFFLTTTISWVFSRVLSIDSTLRWVNLAPFLGMIFDYLENISTSIVIWRFPAHTPLIGSLAGFFTIIKWLFVGGSFVVLILGCILAVWKLIKSWRSTS